MALLIKDAPFYYDSGEAGKLAYRDYQHKVAMTQDITDSIADNTNRSIAANAFFTERVNARIVDAQIASTNAMYNNTQAMLGALDSGLSNVSRQIGAMSAGMGMALAALNTTVQESAQAIYDRLDTMNDILNNPSLTKSRELFRRASVSYNKGFYEEARDDLLEALASNKTDYISWFLLGKTYLFGAGEFSTVIDLDAAVDALKNAVKFITPDARSDKEARVMAAEMCFYLGLAQQTKALDSLHEKNDADCRNYLEQAVVSYSQSFDYSGQMLEARYNRARCKALLGDVQGAIEDLEWLVLQDRNYCVKVCADNDFSSIAEQFAALIKKLKNAVYIPAKNDYDRIKTLLSEFASLGGTTKVTIPATFTDDTPYFDVLDYTRDYDFKQIISIVEKDIAEKKTAIARAEQVEKERQAKTELEANLAKLRGQFAKYQGHVAAGSAHTVALKANGMVVAVGNSRDGQCNVSDWRGHNIIAITAGDSHTVGLKADGTIVAVGNNRDGQCNVSNWRDMVAIAAGSSHTVGLKTDSTVVAAGNNNCDRL